MRELLNDALHEIESLRRQNEVLQAKVEVVNIFGVALLGPRPQMGMTPDVCWGLRQAIKKLETETPGQVA